ncbi:hypothetical protein [Streptomyces cavernicola]|uniref:Uncharacterized protein n=1 Tax=Streptomyces cavernicola TaxID=3043613 RepID=A0ABT6SM52_9ACTN|nr:hypothetical protein [Streptomyces sp. B-S-A6]MDI3409050.1 hypothetical protein [Streptomyces sp. B-S-A6]
MGLSQEELSYLKHALRHARAERSSAAVELLDELPPHTLSLWAGLFRRVLTAVSARELFLRTGYSLDVLETAVEWLGRRALPDE